MITDGLKKLEYRGYDSVGIAILEPDSTKTGNGKIELKKEKGMVEEVSTTLKFTQIDGTIGIGHTRWATHGAVCRENAHPHTDCSGSIVLAHNGVIENFIKIKKILDQKNHKFKSETDSEVIAHLIEENAKSTPMLKAFIKSIQELEGSYGIVAINANEKHGEERETLYIARKNSPLIIGIGKGEMFCASDIPALLKYTKTFVPLEEGDIATITKNGYKVYSLEGKEITRKQITVDWNVEMAQKGGHTHFMHKEIFDQVHFVNESLSSDVIKAKALVDDSSGKFDRIDIIAAGTSYHSGLLLSYLLQNQGKNAQAFVASDYPFIAKPNERTLIIAISQSGETADVLQALRYAKTSGSKNIAITNVVGSTITNLVTVVVFLNSGPEIGVAATKTFTSQLAVIYKLVYPKEKLAGIAKIFEIMLAQENEIKKIAQSLVKKEHAFFIGRGRNVPIAYEGSLK
ncbi:glutamine--fructose-6-phosphate transaminase (isomerizing), partial [Candidatus Micrarchaeota archaeon]|nr:glutamine--fructose-6-phosphate transaminase (isomerizing) [Candidatus Micrarchaeota archaeon]